MARPTSIRVMISSRANSAVFAERLTLTACRRRLKEHVEAEVLFGERLFDVWIHEDAEAAPGTADAWDESLRQIRVADVVVVLYDGEAGWALTAGDVGICHAELMAAMSSEPGKVYLVKTEPLAELAVDAAARARDERFREYVERRKQFHGRIAADYPALEAQVAATLRQAVAELTHLGVRGSRRGQWASGDSLTWARLNFLERKQVMEEVTREALLERGGAERGDGLALDVDRRPVLFLPHAVPAAFTVAAARELVGQPFLRDHQHAGDLADDLAGPVHLIACQRGTTENQAARLLGFPDATIVATPFGVWVADEVQKVQLVLVANCRDETTTRHGLQRLFEWLEQSGEAELLARRAVSRARIVRTLAEEFAEEG